MSEPIATSSDQKEWDLDGALNPVWKALSLHNAADAIKQMQRDNSDVKRSTLLALIVKFSEEQRDKQLLIAYDALGQYLMDRGAITMHYPPGREAQQIIANVEAALGGKFNS